MLLEKSNENMDRNVLPQMESDATIFKHGIFSAAFFGHVTTVQVIARLWCSFTSIHSLPVAEIMPAMLHSSFWFIFLPPHLENANPTIRWNIALKVCSKSSKRRVVTCGRKCFWKVTLLCHVFSIISIFVLGRTTSCLHPPPPLPCFTDQTVFSLSLQLPRTWHRGHITVHIPGEVSRLNSWQQQTRWALTFIYPDQRGQLSFA